MANCIPNDVVSILIILNEHYRHYRRVSRLYAQRYSNCQHPNTQIINIKRRFCRNSSYRHEPEIGHKTVTILNFSKC